VAFEGEHGVLRPHSAAVVLHTYQPPAALFEADEYARRARVEAVLDKLLDHCDGPFHNLASRYLVGNSVRQDADARGAVLVLRGGHEGHVAANGDEIQTKNARGARGASFGFAPL
jgi:hypothetical protein